MPDDEATTTTVEPEKWDCTICGAPFLEGEEITRSYHFSQHRPPSLATEKTPPFVITLLAHIGCWRNRVDLLTLAARLDAETNGSAADA